MLSNIVVQKLIYLEVKKLIILYKKEIKKYLNYNFLDYFKNLLFPKNRNKYYRFIRIFLLFFIIRFIIDIIRFFFNFYYITLNWFFYNLKFSIKFYTDDELIIYIYSKLIDFVKYFILFIPLVNLSNTLNKQKVTLLGYIFFRIARRIIKIIKWRPRLKKRLIIFIKALKIFIVWFGLMPAVAIRDFFLIFIRIIEVFYLFFLDWILFFKTLYYVWQYNRIAGVEYLRKGSSLFHLSVILQKHGFKAPKANKYDKVKAFFDYKSYCRRYKKNEISPDYLNDEALDIYIFLLELFSETRYELKHLPIKEFFFIFFPYEFLANLFIFLYYLYIGIIFVLYCLFFFPLVFIYLGIGLMSDYWEFVRVMHFIFFRDLTYLENEKDKIWKNIRKNALKRKKIEFYKKKYSPYFSYLNNKLLKIIKLIKKFYEKIIR